MELNESTPAPTPDPSPDRRRKPIFLLLGIAAVALSAYGVWHVVNPPVPQEVTQNLIETIDLGELPTEDGTNGNKAPSQATVVAPKNDAEKIAAEQRKEELKKQIANSSFKKYVNLDTGEIDCEGIFKEYEAEIENSVNAKQISQKLIVTWDNDPLLIHCQKDPELMRRFNEAYSKLDAIKE